MTCLFEFELDRTDELLADLLGRLRACIDTHRVDNGNECAVRTRLEQGFQRRIQGSVPSAMASLMSLVPNLTMTESVSPARTRTRHIAGDTPTRSDISRHSAKWLGKQRTNRKQRRHRRRSRSWCCTSPPQPERRESVHCTVKPGAWQRASNLAGEGQG